MKYQRFDFALSKYLNYSYLGTNPYKRGCSCDWLYCLFVKLIVCYESKTHFLFSVYNIWRLRVITSFI